MIIRELITKLGFQIDDAAIKRFDSSIQGIAKKAEGLASSLGKMGTKLSLAVTTPLIAAGGFALKAAGDFEQTQLAFETMLGSADKAKTFIGELFDFAAQTPFEIGDLTEASKRLLAYGLQTKDVIPVLTDLGNITAGLGKEKLPFLITALGQVNTKTKLAGQELNQFLENGVEIIPYLAKVTGHSIAEITDQTKELGITYAQVREALGLLANTKFYGLMSKQSKTLMGQWSNFKDQLSREAIEIGNIIAPYALELLRFLQKAFKAFQELSPETKKWIVLLGAVAAAIGPILLGLAALGSAIAFVTTNWGFIALVVPILAKVLAGVLALYLLWDDFSAHIEGRPNLFGPFWEKTLEGINWLIEKWNNMMRLLNDAILVFKTDVGPWLDWLKEKFTVSFDTGILKKFYEGLMWVWDGLKKINDYLGFTDKLGSILDKLNPLYGFDNAAQAIRNRANEIDPSRKLRGFTPLYVSPLELAADRNYIGPKDERDVKLIQSLNIKVEAGSNAQEIADEISKTTQKLLGEQSSTISNAVAGGPIN